MTVDLSQLPHHRPEEGPQFDLAEVHLEEARLDPCAVRRSSLNEMTWAALCEMVPTNLA